MKICKCFILCVFLLISIGSMSGLAQHFGSDDLKEMVEKVNENKINLISVSSEITNSETQRDDIFFDIKWSPGIVYTQSKEFLNCSVRYNILKNRMEIKIGKEIRSLHTNKLIGIFLGERLFVPLLSNEKGASTSKEFYEVLTEGSLALINKYSLTLHNAGGSTLMPKMGTKQVYKISKALYFCKDGQIAQKLKKGKKNVLKLFTKNEKEVESYADSAGIGYRKEKDLISIFKKYSEISN